MIKQWTINNVLVTQDYDKRVHWQSRGKVDADGSNGQNGNAFAYRTDDQGLDRLSDAGWPNNGWRNVLVTDHRTDQPVDDGNGNLYSMTTYVWPNCALPDRYVDATAIPYVVVNPIVREGALGVVIGCRARITYKNQTIDAVVADVSGPKDIGEMSIAAARLLGIGDDPRKGGVDSGVLFEFWPDQPATLNGTMYLLQPA